jgi:hypothetical protein
VIAEVQESLEVLQAAEVALEVMATTEVTVTTEAEATVVTTEEIEEATEVVTMSIETKVKEGLLLRLPRVKNETFLR